MSAEDLTCDTVGGGRNQRLAEDKREEPLKIWQRARGYRFGLDALLLATDLPPLSARDEGLRIVELGAAHGIVSLCVARQWPDAQVVAVERQQALFDLMVRNIAENQLQARVHPVHLDLREIGGTTAQSALQSLRAHSTDLVICNPPYFRAGVRRVSQDDERGAARHELHGGVADFMRAARYILKQRGRLKLILPPLRLADIFGALDEGDFALEQLRFFHSHRRRDAYLVEVVLRRGGAPDLKVLPPLYIYGKDGEYSPEVRRRIELAAQPGGAQHDTRHDV